MSNVMCEMLRLVRVRGGYVGLKLTFSWVQSFDLRLVEHATGLKRKKNEISRRKFSSLIEHNSTSSCKIVANGITEQ